MSYQPHRPCTGLEPRCGSVTYLDDGSDEGRARRCDLRLPSNVGGLHARGVIRVSITGGERRKQAARQTAARICLLRAAVPRLLREGATEQMLAMQRDGAPPSLSRRHVHGATSQRRLDALSPASGRAQTAPVRVPSFVDQVARQAAVDSVNFPASDGGEH